MGFDTILSGLAFLGLCTMWVVLPSRLRKSK